jgi:hypothetical protein
MGTCKSLKNVLPLASPTSRFAGKGSPVLCDLDAFSVRPWFLLPGATFISQRGPWLVHLLTCSRVGVGLLWGLSRFGAGLRVGVARAVLEFYLVSNAFRHAGLVEGD